VWLELDDAPGSLSWETITFTGSGGNVDVYDNQLNDDAVTISNDYSEGSSLVTINLADLARNFSYAQLLFVTRSSGITSITINDEDTSPGGYLGGSGGKLTVESYGNVGENAYINSLSFIVNEVIEYANGSVTVGFASSKPAAEPNPNTPEPATLLIFGCGMVGAGIVAARRRKK
jgi:hypothetical protein